MYVISRSISIVVVFVVLVAVLTWGPGSTVKLQDSAPAIPQNPSLKTAPDGIVTFTVEPLAKSSVTFKITLLPSNTIARPSLSSTSILCDQTVIEPVPGYTA